MGVPMRVELYDKNFQQVGTIGDPKFVTVICQRNAGGSASFGVRSNHRRIDRILTPGTRAVFLDEHDAVAHSGRILGYGGNDSSSSMEVTVGSDFTDIFQNTLGWVVPTGAITAQGTAGSNWTATGPAETVLINALQANVVNRLGRPLNLPSSLGRGSNVKASLRFQSLGDRLLPVVDGAGIAEAGICFRIYQFGGELVLDVWEPRTIPQVLSEKSGVIRSWSYTYDHPVVTRVIVGGEGEAQLRLFRERIDAARETELGTALEVFRDARDTDDPTEMYARADETLAEGDRRTGLAVELSETANFRFKVPNSAGRGVTTGDVVKVKLGGIEVVQPLQEATLSLTADGGFISRPRIGDRQDDPDKKIAAKLKNIIRSLRVKNSET